MNRFFLNIGMQRNDGGGLMRLSAVVDAVEDRFDILSVEPVDSTTELTAVVICEVEEGVNVDDVVYSLSEALSQDCIAVWDWYTGRGDLVGPEAEAWG